MLEYKSTNFGINRPTEKLIWPGNDNFVITLTNPCLENEGLVTFEQQLLEYDVCQNETAIGASFTFTDKISTLSSTPDYCGDPVISAVFAEDYNQDMIDPF